MENHRTPHFGETSGFNNEANSNQNEIGLTRFMKILKIEQCEFKGGSSARVSPPVVKEAAVQTDEEFLNIARPRLICIGNKVNTICKELSELMKSISKLADSRKDEDIGNCYLGDAVEMFNIGTVNQIEEKLETSLKIVLVLKGNFTALTAKDKSNQSSALSINSVQSSKVYPRREPAKNKNLRLCPFDVDEVFPRVHKTSQMKFNIFRDKDQRDIGRARAVVAPTRGGTNIINAIQRQEGINFYCSTPKNSVQIKSQNSALPKAPPKLSSSNPPSKGVRKCSATNVQKKTRSQINPQKPAWR